MSGKAHAADLRGPFVEEAVALEHGMTAEEYARVCAILGRKPTATELGMVSVMWSEHCSYKSSRVHLRTLPTEGPAVVQGPGENAGAVDLGDGLVGVFKVESHNHPSYIEPYQGAATGVGRSAGTATCWTAWWAASPATATAWASPPWAARSTSTRATTATRS